MKQTAVEWFNQQLIDRQDGNIGSRSRYEILEQAKEMEKKQIIDAYETAMETDIYNVPLKVGKQYYNETFKTK